jgi:hypothetical protein
MINNEVSYYKKSERQLSLFFCFKEVLFIGSLVHLFISNHPINQPHQPLTQST